MVPIFPWVAHESLALFVKLLNSLLFQIFWDLASLSEYEQDMCSELKITNNETIGRGGYGFVCEGQLLMKARKEYCTLRNTIIIRDNLQQINTLS